MVPRSSVMARVVLQQTSPSLGRKRTFSVISTNSKICSLVWTVGIILIYFSLSIGLTFYQRWFMKRAKLPFSVALCHIALKLAAAVAVKGCWRFWSGRQRTTLTWRETLCRVAPVGLASGIDISFSNWGLELISVSLYTMTKSTSIIFILFFALLLKLERKSWSLIFIVGMIAGGLFLFTYKSTQFDFFGFLAVLFASFSSGIRWTLAQVLMQRAELGLEHPLDMLYHLQPWMFLAILPLAAIIEGSEVSRLAATTWRAANWAVAAHNAFLVLIGAAIAFTMEMAEYQVVASLSSLTLSIAGIVKEIVTLLLAVKLNGNEMSALNLTGLLLCLGGVVLHVAAKANTPPPPRPLPDDAAARFLADDTSTDEDDRGADDPGRDDSSTEVLFSVLNSRDR